MATPPLYETQRLAFTSWELAHFDEFAVLARDPQVMRFIADGTPWPDSKIGWFMGLQRAYQHSLGYCCWRLVEKQTSACIGFCGIAPVLELGETEIGWWLKPSHWHQGYALEAAQHVERVAFEEHGLGRLVARAYAENVASVRLVGKLGMTFSRELHVTAVGAVQLFEKEPE